MKKSIYAFKLTVAFMIFITSSSAIASNIYYVSTYGSPYNDGLSLPTSFRNITDATKIAGSGDIINVATGTYVEKIRMNSDYVTLQALPGNTPVVDGYGMYPNTDWSALAKINANYCTLKGIEIKNSNINGQYLGGFGLQVLGHNNVVDGVNSHHSWETGIMVNGDSNTVINSVVWQNARHNFNGAQLPNGSGWASGLSAGRNEDMSTPTPGITQHPVFKNNKVFNNWGEGISCFESNDCLIEGNTVYDNWTVNLYISDTTNASIIGNLVYVSMDSIITRYPGGGPGIFLGDELSNKPRTNHSLVYNNLVFGTNISAFTSTEVPGSELTNSAFINNTVIKGKLKFGNVGVGNVVYNNLIVNNEPHAAIPNGITASNNSLILNDMVNMLFHPLNGPRAGKLTYRSFKLVTPSSLPNGYTLSTSIDARLTPVDYTGAFRSFTTPKIGALKE